MAKFGINDILNAKTKAAGQQAQMGQLSQRGGSVLRRDGVRDAEQIAPVGDACHPIIRRFPWAIASFILCVTIMAVR